MKTNRERLNAILHYQNYDRMPIMHFGFWQETLEKWVKEGHLAQEDIAPILNRGNNSMDGSEAELKIAQKLGFDDNFLVFTGQKGGWANAPLWPVFEEKVVRQLDGDHFVKIDRDGVYVKTRKGAVSIAEEIDHSAKDRETWEKNYVPRLAWSDERLDMEKISALIDANNTHDRHTCVYCGSLFGKLRNYWGIVEISYLQADDPDLFDQCLNDIAEVCFMITKKTLETGVKLDFAHFWEDICYNHGPLIQPELFREKAGPGYRRIADECAKHGIDIISVDCDGYVEDLVPVWLDNGINTMFPIEYGAWEYDFETMRKKFGKELRGVGNIKKNALAQDKKAVDHEVERAKRLVDLGGFIPCPDHRIAPDAEWDLTRYYCDRMKEAFWK
jgi:uroporphyrinogen decarboxylase